MAVACKNLEFRARDKQQGVIIDSSNKDVPSPEYMPGTVLGIRHSSQSPSFHSGRKGNSFLLFWVFFLLL